MSTLVPHHGKVSSADRAAVAEPVRPTGLRGWLASLRAAVDRPLTCYYLLIGASALLLTVGLIMVLSASSVYAFKIYGNSYAIAERQLLWVGIGIPCAWVASRVPERWLRRLAWPGYFVALALLAATQLGLGKTVNGNTNWLGIGPIVIQPSEVAKLALIIWAAHIYTIKERLLADWKHCIVPVVPGLAIATGLVLWGRDLGTGLIFFALALGLMWAVGAPGRLFAMGFLTSGVFVYFLAATDAERRDRLLNFTDPFADFLNSGWQPAHGLYALSSGGIFGQGIGASTQKWGDLPEAHTDYIFAVLGEELGLVGTLLVLGLFLIIAYAGLRVALNTERLFTRYVSFAIVIWLVGQMMINVGMVLALLPVIGIPLPLVSYGGSALVPALVALGLLIGFARSEPEAAAALAAKRGRTGAAGLSAARRTGRVGRGVGRLTRRRASANAMATPLDGATTPAKSTKTPATSTRASMKSTKAAVKSTKAGASKSAQSGKSLVSKSKSSKVKSSKVKSSKSQSSKSARPSRPGRGEAKRGRS